MENKLQLFNNDSFGEIRSIVIDNKVYFVGSDVARMLGYKEPHKALARHCRYGVKHPVWVKTGVRKDGQDALRETEMVIIPEGDIIRLIANSKLPKAIEIESWIFDDVIPTILRTGSYTIDERKSDGWGMTRLEGQQERKGLTDNIQRLIDYGKEQGQESSKWYYVHITKALNKALFRVESLKKIKKNLRDEIDINQLSFVATLERILSNKIEDLLDTDLDCKYIYKELKKTCLVFSDMIGQEKPKYITTKEYCNCLTKSELKQLEANKNQFKLL